jgi:hypothetical protein
MILQTRAGRQIPPLSRILKTHYGDRIEKGKVRSNPFWCPKCGWFKYYQRTYVDAVCEKCYTVAKITPDGLVAEEHSADPIVLLQFSPDLQAQRKQWKSRSRISRFLRRLLGKHWHDEEVS